MTDAADNKPLAAEARRLLRAARVGTLATATAGQPFAALITPATGPDGAILMLLSDLSEHTRHLRTDGRCAVLVAGPPAEANPQTAPRLSLTGVAERVEDLALKARWVALHPYAAFYAGFADFALWRLPLTAGLFVRGFASAHRLRQADLACDAEAVAAIAAAEARVLAHCNEDHADTLDLIANDNGCPGTGWRMITADCDGFDLAQDETVRRIDWPTPVDSPIAIRAALVDLAGAARHRQ